MHIFLESMQTLNALRIFFKRYTNFDTKHCGEHFVENFVSMVAASFGCFGVNLGSLECIV